MGQGEQVTCWGLARGFWFAIMNPQTGRKWWLGLWSAGEPGGPGLVHGGCLHPRLGAQEAPYSAAEQRSGERPRSGGSC